jgi:hypothetical protein
MDTVVWDEESSGAQKDTLKPEFRDILSNFSERFVVGFDYGPSNRQTKSYLRRRVRNTRLIMRDLPDEAKHNIGYRNAWLLLTGTQWQ